MSSIEITIPAQAEAIRVVRSVANAIAADIEFPYDKIEDLNLGIAEAAGFMLGSGATLRCQISRASDAVTVKVGADSEPPTWDGSLSQVVVEAVASGVEAQADGISFTVSR